MTVKRTGITMCLAALLTLPVIALADHGQDGSDGGSVSSEPHGDNHGQNGNSGNDHGGTATAGANPGVGAEPGDDHGGNANAADDNRGPVANANGELQRNGVSLAATAAGTAIGASGHADIRVRGNEQRLSIEVEANVPDGTMFSLTANTTPIGVITIHLGEGEFEFESDNGQTLTGGLAAAAITSIVVSDSSNAPILQAQFGAITTANPPLSAVLAVRKELRFTATATGVTVRAEGNADLRSQGADTRLKVEVEAQAPDGTVWTILANSGVRLGTVTFKLMEAELRLETADLLQAGLSDASAITSIQVNDAGGNLVLSGTF